MQCQSEVHAMAFQGTEEPLFRTQYLRFNHDYRKGRGWFSPDTSQVKRGGGEQDLDGQHDLWAGLAGFLPHILHQGFPKLYNYLVTGVDE
jgi:hypothetical protein